MVGWSTRESPTELIGRSGSPTSRLLSSRGHGAAATLTRPSRRCSRADSTIERGAGRSRPARVRRYQRLLPCTARGPHPVERRRRTANNSTVQTQTTFYTLPQPSPAAPTSSSPRTRRTPPRQAFPTVSLRWRSSHLISSSFDCSVAASKTTSSKQCSAYR